MKHKIISTLEIALSNIRRDGLVHLNAADVHQCSKVDFPCCCFVCLLCDLVSFLIHCCLWSERSFAHAHGFPRLAFLRDLQNLLNHTELTVSRGWLNRITSGVCTPFFPVPLLRASRTSWAFRFIRRILSHRYAVPRNEARCSCFHLWRTKRSIRRNELLH